MTIQNLTKPSAVPSSPDRGSSRDNSRNRFRKIPVKQFPAVSWEIYYGRKRTLSDKPAYQNGSIDTSFGPPPAPLDSTFKYLFNPSF